MIDQTTTVYDAPAAYLPKLIEWAEGGAAHYSAVAAEQRSQSYLRNAQDFEAQAAKCRRIGQWAATRLPDISELSLDDAEQLAEINALTRQINDEPPMQLAPLVDWLKRKVGHWFPSADAETWQTAAYALLLGRRP